MDTRDEIVEIHAGGGIMGAFLARPASDGKWPGAAIGLEGFGVTDHIRGVARRLAAEGYVVLIPDLFYRLGRFATAQYTDYDAARALMHTVSDVEMLADMDAALGYLKSRPDCRGDGLGLVGYRVGGRWAFVTACHRPDVKALVSYYGNITSGDMAGRESPLPTDLIDGLQAAVLMLWGDGEPLSRGEVKDLEELLRAAGKTVENVTYDGTRRGFDVPEDPHYRADSAQDAWKRTVNWLRQYLRIADLPAGDAAD